MRGPNPGRRSRAEPLARPTRSLRKGVDMGHARVIHRIEAPIDHVWKLAVDMDRLPEWNPYWEVRNLTGPFDTVGTTFDGTMKMLGRSIEGVGRVLEVEPEHLIHLEASSPSMGPFDMRFSYDPDGNATLCTFDMEYHVPAGLFGSAIDKLFIGQYIDRQMEHMIGNFAALAEVKVPVGV